MARISFAKGRGNIAHTTRAYIAKNIDKSRMKDNIYYKSGTVKQAYKDIFNSAVAEYNQGKKASRQIKSYYEKIRASGNGEKLFYETLVQVGNRFDFGMFGKSENQKIAKQILDEYVKTWEQRNPNFKIIACAMHNDESTSHLQIDWVPVAHAEKGLRLRNSLSGALAEMGYKTENRNNKYATATMLWQKSERACLTEICKTHGIEIEAPQHTQRDKLTPAQMRNMGAVLESWADKEIELPRTFLGKFYKIDDVKALATQLEAVKVKADFEKRLDRPAADRMREQLHQQMELIEQEKKRLRKQNKEIEERKEQAIQSEKKAQAIYKDAMALVKDEATDIEIKIAQTQPDYPEKRLQALRRFQRDHWNVDDDER